MHDCLCTQLHNEVGASMLKELTRDPSHIAARIDASQATKKAYLAAAQGTLEHAANRKLARSLMLKMYLPQDPCALRPPLDFSPPPAACGEYYPATYPPPSCSWPQGSPCERVGVAVSWCLLWRGHPGSSRRSTSSWWLRRTRAMHNSPPTMATWTGSGACSSRRTTGGNQRRCRRCLATNGSSSPTTWTPWARAAASTSSCCDPGA